MSAPRGQRPPPVARWLLRRVLPDDVAEPVIGDLDELYGAHRLPRSGVRAARRWYWRQAAGVLVARMFWRPLTHRPPFPRRPAAVSAFVQDASYALRTLARQSGFAATAVLTLALGIGANLAIFALLYAVLIRPLPFHDPGALMFVQLLAPAGDEPGVWSPTIWSYPKYRVLRDRQQVFTGTALFTGRDWSLTGAGGPSQVTGELVDATYFDVLGVAPRLGRFFGADESRAPGASAPSIVISHALWQSHFGGDTRVVGRTISLDRVPLTIVGVAPAGFHGLIGQAQVWKPMMSVDAVELDEPFSHSYRQVARRRPGVSIEQAVAAVAVLGGQVNAAFPDGGRRQPWSATAVALDDERVDPVLRRAVLVLAGAVAVVLLIGCVNLANLTLARGLARQREVAIRLALGASRVRIARQFLTESFVLSLLGTAAGALVAIAGVRLAAAAMPDLRNILRGQQAGLTRVGTSMLGVDLTVVLVALALAMLTTMLVGLAPAWRAARGELTATIRAGGSGSLATGVRGMTLRNALVVVEIALALVMLVSAGLMVKSMWRLSGVDLGFRPDRVVTFRVWLPGEAYPRERQMPFIEQLVARLKARGEIESAAFGFCPPVSGGCNGTRAIFPDRPPVARGAEPLVGVTWASPDYFSTLGIRLLRGRWFTEHDRLDTPKVVVVNETAARRFWKNEDPLGQRIGLGQGGFQAGAEVVGIVADVRYDAVETAAGPDVYIPAFQSTRPGGVFFVRSRVSPASLVPVLRAELAALDAELPMTDVKTMAERYGEATWRTWIIGTLLTLLAALAVVLAFIGICGVLAQSVAQRTREIGVRLALGAGRRDILRLVLGRASLLAGVGVAAGLVAAVVATRAMAALLYDVRPDDPAILGGLAVALFGVALVASYIPARRAARVDPLETLRSE